MKKRFSMAFRLIIFILIALFIICLGIPLCHDFIFDKFTVSNYEEKTGVVRDVILKHDDNETCENIVVDNYNIFVQCGDDYKQQFKIGDRTTYYVHKDKGYHTKDQMKSGTFIGKIIDYGMIGSYILIFFLIVFNKDKLYSYIDEMSGNKTDIE